MFAKYLPKQITIAKNIAIGATRLTFPGIVNITNFIIESIPRPCE
ncbi:hypothetical protein F7308_1660 [Francisella salina]|uniref:Uncharacterized protein n=1 Tax=Francisella salina TaxID=573569 RepID=A0ABN3ZN22_FRAST|nr:hypothetical protein F7308_1660 [Francisella salina]